MSISSLAFSRGLLQNDLRTGTWFFFQIKCHMFTYILKKLQLSPIHPVQHGIRNFILTRFVTSLLTKEKSLIRYR
jgi:hypothetical protein